MGVGVFSKVTDTIFILKYLTEKMGFNSTYLRMDKLIDIQGGSQ